MTSITLCKDEVELLSVWAGMPWESRLSLRPNHCEEPSRCADGKGTFRELCKEDLKAD